MKISVIYGCLVMVFLSGAAMANEPSGKALYQSYCAACHGGEMRGGRGPNLLDKQRDREQIFNTVREGRTAQGMPSFRYLLTENQINQLAELIHAAASAGDQQQPLASEKLETLDYALDLTVVVDGLDVPWGIAFLDEHNWLVTERPGRLRQIGRGQLLPEPVSGIP